MSDPHRKDRKWSSKPGAPPVTTIPSMASMADALTPKSSGASSVENTPAMEKQLQYLRKLEERNRIKKKLDEQSKNDKDVHDKEKEVGFTTNFNGENAHRKNKHARMPEAKARAKSAGPMKLPLRTAPVAATLPPQLADDRADSKHPRSGSHSTGTLPLHHTQATSTSSGGRPRHKWTKPEGVAAERDGCIVFAIAPQLSGQRIEGNGDDNPEPEDVDEDYMDESFEEFEDNSTGDEHMWSKEGQHYHGRHDDDEVNDVTPPPTLQAVVLAEPSLPVAAALESQVANLPLGQTTLELNALIQGLTRDKQRELVSVLQTLTHSSKQTADDVPVLQQQSAIDPTVWGQQLTPSMASSQLTSNQRAWEAEVTRKLEFERHESMRLVAEAEARRAERLKKLQDEEMEFETLMAQRRLDMQKKWMDTTTSSFTTNTASVTALTAPVSIPASLMATRSTQEDVPIQPEGPERPVPPTPQAFMAMSIPTGLPPAAPTIPTSSQVKQSTSSSLSVSKPPRWIEVRIKLLSSWGKSRVVGLTQICVYDMDGNELDVPLESLRLFSGQAEGQPIPRSNSMVRDLTRLFNGVATTTSESDMWLGRQIDAHPLQIAFGVYTPPNKLCIWNYNHKLHVAACVRDIEVFVDNQCKWTGSLPETYGSEDENTCTWINVATVMRKKPKDSKKTPTPSAPAPPMAAPTDPPRSSGPIWLPSSTSALSALPPHNNLKPDASLTSLASQAKVEHHLAHHDIKALDDVLSTSVKPSTSRRRNAGEATTQHDLVQPISLPPNSVVGSAMPSLQSSWDTLEHFKRTNRSRLEPPADIASTPRSFPAPDSVAPTFSTAPSNTNRTTAVLTRSTSQSSSMADLLRPATLPTYPPTTKIPILPTGRKLVMECLSTWGDPYYIGLNGLDVFDDRGQAVKVASPQDQVTAVPASINILPEYATAKARDPRVAANIVDGVNYTCDDLHMWLAPFTPHQVHSVTVEFNTMVTISLLRVWNYNKSRAHSFRGVKLVRVLLDGQEIFQGEIRQAPGILGAVDQCCEVILFTTDESLLSMIEQVDDDPTVDVTSAVVHDIQSIPRPSTAEERNNQRPNTAYAPVSASPPSMQPKDCDGVQQHPPPACDMVQQKQKQQPTKGFRGRTLQLVVLSTWGDRHYVGLTGISLWVLPQDGSSKEPTGLSLTPHQLDATPRDLQSLGYTGDPRTLDKLVDGVNVTCDDTHMWLVPFEGGKAEVRVHLATETAVYGLDVWNYNKSAEDTYRGVKSAIVLIDNVVVATVALRKAPGHALFDFKQSIVLGEWALYRSLSTSSGVSSTYKTHVLKQDYEPPLLPSGFLFKFVLWSTWGDPYYVGLNGIELYDTRGDKLPPPTLVAALPTGLADVQVKQDIRVVQNLFQGINNTWDAAEAWLAPLASSLGQCDGNVVFAMFDTPVTVSMIKIYNYSKTPDRGAREIEIYVDDLKVYMGSLRQAPPSPGVTRLGKVQQGVEFGQPILFTLNPAQVEHEKRKVVYCGSEDQDVLCINEGQVVIESKAMHRAPDPGAEGVVVDLDKRPTTAMCRT
ncbi:hypothetical protein, variant [Aphanomyces astaci]|uniref:KATNIP domain-containing protein n=1 Tax=Aphanomyces astaci TaxID=112090 RepID=W4FCV5_APHAT|nr:hypothetical protein, variant [Aphanomyces astaci]ETV65305.1 hypothetical protein, variant [Aphanomyces astaci]|eukprot:XP_009845231.1 hypothetical protein, variant [Aphanomyces astaci]